MGGWGGRGIFFLNDTATTEIYTLSLRDALPISSALLLVIFLFIIPIILLADLLALSQFKFGLKLFEKIQDRKSTRLNSSHQIISYAVFCLKKKNHQRLLKDFTRRMRTPRPLPSS